MTDYGRSKFENKKRVREVAKRSPRSALKELRLSCEIGEHDYQLKLKSAQDMLLARHEIKLQIILVDSDSVRDERAVAFLNRFANDLGDLATWIEEPKLEKKRREKLATLLISPASLR
ncbi:MAG: hypothetical protein WCT03_15050 [Candidatus Obscuribacterales bacterium]